MSLLPQGKIKIIRYELPQFLAITTLKLTTSKPSISLGFLDLKSSSLSPPFHPSWEAIFSHVFWIFAVTIFSNFACLLNVLLPVGILKCSRKFYKK